MDSLQNFLEEQFTHAILQEFPQAEDLNIGKAQIRNAFHKSMAKYNYQCDSAFGIFGRLKKHNLLPDDCQNSLHIADKIVNHIPESEIIQKLDVSSGFINIQISPNYLARRTVKISQEGLKVSLNHDKKRVAIDYSSPNIAKEMHVGHLRSTIIGDVISRILEYLDHQVKRFNHLGDWGTQFGMLIAYIKDNSPELTDLSLLYKEAKKQFDNDKDFKDRSLQEVVKLQNGDSENLEIWKELSRISQESFSQIYQKLSIHPELQNYGESFYNDKLPSIVEELENKNLVTISQGAKMIFVNDVPLILQKNDGGFGYDSTDLAALKYRLQEEQANWIIYVVDSGQSTHFSSVFKVAQQAGWYDPTIHRLEHVGFGVIQGNDKKRIKSRSGDSIPLIDLLDEAKERIKKELNQRLENGNSQIAGSEIDYVSECLGYGGLKYFDLRQNRKTDYVFDYDKMLSAEGDTAVYIEYAHARIQSIFRRLEREKYPVDQLIKQGEENPELIEMDNPSTYALVEKLSKWSDVCQQFEKTLLPNIITNFLYELTGNFADFYRDCKLLGLTNYQTLAGRLVVVKATCQTIATILELLGIQPLDKL